MTHCLTLVVHSSSPTRHAVCTLSYSLKLYGSISMSALGAKLTLVSISVRNVSLKQLSYIIKQITRNSLLFSALLLVLGAQMIADNKKT
ncbi:hypothetical protein THF5G08_30481 [Vibrio jasicida]|nr:hypothetical protein THF5G08_30481 [Vibrio jasicida]